MTRKRIIALMLSCVLLVPAFGCGKREARESGGVESSDSAASNLKTNIFAGEALPLPDGFVLYSSVTPYWDADARALTCVAACHEEITLEDGTVGRVSVPFLVTTTADGVSDSREIPLGDGMSLFRARITADEVLMIVRPTDSAGETAVRWDPVTGERWQSGELNAYFNDRSAPVLDWLGDEAGKNYLVSFGQLVILDDDWMVIRSVELPYDENTTLGVDESGQVYVGTGMLFTTLTPIDPETGEPGAERTLSGSNPVFGGDFPYCWLGDQGIDAALLDGTSRQIMNLRNSGLTRDGFYPILVPDADTVIVAERQGSGMYSGFDFCPMIYTRQPDVDMTNARTLRLAGCIGTSFSREITVFMSKHPDVIVEVEDYNQYGPTAEGPGGSYRLAREIAAGKCRADVLVGFMSDQTADTVHMYQAYDKEFYVDLAPYIEKDAGLNGDSLLGAARRIFDDGAGHIWGLAPSVMLSTVIAPTELLGKYAEQGYWTLSDMMDFYENLPEGVEFLQGFTRETAADFLFKNMAYREFIDEESAVCSFDSPEFVRVLEFIGKLPTKEEYRRNSPYAELTWESRNPVYWSGKIAARETKYYDFWSWCARASSFNETNITLIGYPTAEKRAGAGTLVNGMGVVITKACSDPDLAWEFVRSLFSNSDFQNYPVRREDLEKQLAGYLGAAFVSNLNGESSMWIRGLGNQERKEPGVVAVFAEEDIRALEDEMEKTGTAFLNRRAEDVYAIIREELSAFLVGHGSAEDCAEKIQSRAGLWLAEHS